MIPPSWEPEYLGRVSRQVYESRVAADPDDRWLEMTWLFWNERSVIWGGGVTHASPPQCAMNLPRNTELAHRRRCFFSADLLIYFITLLVESLISTKIYLSVLKSEILCKFAF